MDNLLTESQKENEAKREKAIRVIKQRKASKAKNLRIKTALGRHKNFKLMKLEVPLKDKEGNTIGWRVLCTEAEVHDRIIKRNKQHLNQASATPFGHGAGYNALHGPDREIFMKEINQGSLQWENPIDEVNRLVEGLKLAYDQKSLVKKQMRLDRLLQSNNFRTSIERNEKVLNRLPVTDMWDTIRWQPGIMTFRSSMSP